MTETLLEEHEIRDGRSWLKSYYFARAAFSIAWVIVAFTLAADTTVLAGALLIVYPAWDAVANVVDAQRNGGLRRNASQSLNAIVSTLTTAAVAVALGMSMFAVLAVFGVWATLSGLFQLATGIRRWRSVGAQWAMVLSGAQSAVVGVMFLVKASGPAAPGIVDVAPYAGFGAFYFLVSALWLAYSGRRRGPA
jgi:uncharacterized membrane protein HdeD (DUF308 family)